MKPCVVPLFGVDMAALILNNHGSTAIQNAEVAELADAQDSKSCRAHTR
jgi:hypothetical protein